MNPAIAFKVYGCYSLISEMHRTERCRLWSLLHMLCIIICLLKCHTFLSYSSLIKEKIDSLFYQLNRWFPEKCIACLNRRVKVVQSCLYLRLLSQKWRLCNHAFTSDCSDKMSEGCAIMLLPQIALMWWVNVVQSCLYLRLLTRWVKVVQSCLYLGLLWWDEWRLCNHAFTSDYSHEKSECCAIMPLPQIALTRWVKVVITYSKDGITSYFCEEA